MPESPDRMTMVDMLAYAIDPGAFDGPACSCEDCIAAALTGQGIARAQAREYLAALCEPPPSAAAAMERAYYEAGPDRAASEYFTAMLRAALAEGEK